MRVIGLSDANNNDSKIYDVYDCLYFSLVTFTTVGYGDFHPVDDCTGGGVLRSAFWLHRLRCIGGCVDKHNETATVSLP